MNIFRTAFSQVLLYFLTITFYVVVLEYVFTSRTGWKKNEKEVAMSVQLNERWKQKQFDNWPAMKSANLSEQALKNEKRRIERTTAARELCFQNKSVVILCHSSYPPHPYFENSYFFMNAHRNSKRKKHRKIEELRTGWKILQWIEMKTTIELKTLMYKSINK